MVNHPKNVHVVQSNAIGNKWVYLSEEEYNEYLQYQASKEIPLPVASIAPSPTFESCIVDSGASDHIPGDKSLFVKYCLLTVSSSCHFSQW
uniref:Putative ovule protein n=1 Tax=Solanum chacoense TaxID=4108 RepID=A0A0V0GNZ5_SOLCH